MPLTCESPSTRTAAPLTSPVIHFPSPKLWGNVAESGSRGICGFGRLGGSGGPQLLPSGAPRSRKGSEDGACGSPCGSSPAEGLRSSARPRVPAWVSEGRRSRPRPPLRRPGHGCAKCSWVRGRSLGGAEPAGAGTVGEPGLEFCRAGRRASRGPCVPQPLRAEALPPLPGPAPALAPRDLGGTPINGKGRARFLPREEPLWTLGGDGEPPAPHGRDLYRLLEPGSGPIS